MDRALNWSPAAEPGLARRFSAGVLLAASGALTRLALRIGRPAAVAQPAHLEVGFIEVAGARRAAIYADGELVGIVPGNARL